MCKLFAITNTKKLSTIDISNIIMTCHDSMSGEKHGFGFAYATKNNSVYGERYNDPKDFITRYAAKDYGPYSKNFAPKNKLDFNTFGKISNPMGALIVHGRTSTNTHSLLNTHPLTNKDYALIHNGIVENIGHDIKRRTQNDTEYILEHYTSGGINNVEKSVAGYYAVAAINRKDLSLHLFRDSIASLYFCYSKKIDAYMFATTETILEKILKALKTKADIAEAPKNFHAIFDKNGTMQSFNDITPTARSFGKKDYDSLGYDATYKYSGYDYGQKKIEFESYFDENEKYDYVMKDGSIITEKEFDSMTYYEQQEVSIYQKGKRVM